MNGPLAAIAAVLSALLWAATSVAWAARQGAFAEAWRDWSGGSRLRKALSFAALAALVSWAGAKPEGEIIESSNNRIIESADGAGLSPVGAAFRRRPQGDVSHGATEARRDSEVLDRIDKIDGIEAGSFSLRASVAPCEKLVLAADTTSLSNPVNPVKPVNPVENSLSLVRVGRNEVFDFSAPDGATVAEKWRRRGASKDYLRLNFTDWAFPFGDESFSNLVVFAGGRIRLSRDAELCPFAANLGLVPEANWGMSGASASDDFNAKNAEGAKESVGAALRRRPQENVSHGATEARSSGLVGRDDLIAPQVAASSLSLQGQEGREGQEGLEAEEKRLSYHSPPQASTSTSLFLSVPRGQTAPLYLRADETLAVAFASDDFAFGSLPDLAASRLVGRINFPNVTATTPCFHDYKARRKPVSLPVGDGADKLDLRRFYWTVCLLLCFLTTEETERIGRNGKKAPDQAASRNPWPIIRFLAHSRSWASSRCSVALGEKPKSATLRAKEYERNRIPYRGKCKARREPYRAAASEMPPYPCTMVGAHLRCARRWFCNFFVYKMYEEIVLKGDLK